MLKALKIVYGVISVVFFLLYLVYSHIMSSEFYHSVEQVRAKGDLHPLAFSDYVTSEVFIILGIILFLIHIIVQFVTAFVETKQRTSSLITLAGSFGLLITSAVIIGCFFAVCSFGQTPNERKWIEENYHCCYDYTSINGTDYYVNCSCPFFTEEVPRADSQCSYCRERENKHEIGVFGLMVSAYFFIPIAIIYFFLTFIYDILFITFSFKRTMKQEYSDLPQ